MTIDSRNYFDVLERFIALDTNKYSFVQEINEKLYESIKELDELNKHLNNPDIRFDERSKMEQRVKSARKERLLCLERLRDIQSAPRTEEMKVTDAIRKDQFERICRFPKVIDAYVDKNGAVVIVISATYALDGIVYDLGDWALSFGCYTETDLFDLVNARDNNRQAGWDRGAYPDYTQDRGSFCIGLHNRTRINQHIAEERYVQAVMLATFVVNSINNKAQEIAQVAEAFYPIVPYVFHPVHPQNKEQDLEYPQRLAG